MSILNACIHRHTRLFRVLGYAHLLCMLCMSCNKSNPFKQPEKEQKISFNTLPASRGPIEDPNFVVSNDTVSPHGPRSITRNMIQDKNGNYWFATWEGILFYDGKVFTNITLKEGLRHFHVFSVVEDHTETLWFGTIGGGVYRYDGTTFKYFTSADGLVSDVVLCISEDSSGNIWFGTDKGASRYDGSSFTNFTKQEGLSLGQVYAIEQDKVGTLWLGTDEGVVLYDGQSFSKFTNKDDSSPFYRVHAIVEDKRGNIWMGNTDGLCRYDPVASRKLGEKILTNITTSSVHNMFEDKNGNIWLSESNPNMTGMTLSKYDEKDKVKITTDIQIFGAIEDNIGNIWFGTVNGVSRLDHGRSHAIRL
jgi:ligand-binding sensor domain-containing protein